MRSKPGGTFRRLWNRPSTPICPARLRHWYGRTSTTPPPAGTCLSPKVPVCSKQTGTLGDKQVPAGGGVVDVRPYQCLNLAGQIGVDGLFQSRRNVPPGFDLIPAKRFGPSGFQIVFNGA